MYQPTFSSRLSVGGTTWSRIARVSCFNRTRGYQRLIDDFVDDIETSGHAGKETLHCTELISSPSGVEVHVH